ncbi:hypothetical protein [Pseudomonas sp. MPR-ANC1]|uniref:hypothetical protein n=1 Tax=Pseudomonas sp. MPR-ANC1 TaxID=2075548 RepID=UPI0011AF5149|nr:hypothetical protein [Pseudomonas sp. MPR-ANC1]
MSIKVKERHRCGSCRTVHDSIEDAKECCAPTITSVYVCPACKGSHDDPDKALECCGVEGIRCPSCYRDYNSASIHFQAIKVAGHCNICNPLLTVDQQFAIEDMHYEQAGQRLCLHDGAKEETHV